MDQSVSHAQSDSSTTYGIYSRYLLGVLVIAYTIAFLDRQILSLLVDPIRHDLQITDVQFSLLQGLAFAIFYSVLGLAIGRFADSFNRRNIIAVSIILWSVMTAMCGLATSFGILFLFRMGVGIGEGGLSPPAYSMIADAMPRSRLSRAMSIYSIGLPAGAGLALLFGGYAIKSLTASPSALPILRALHPWQQIFILIGLPGLLVGAFVFTLREPARRDKATTAAALPLGVVISYVRFNLRLLSCLFVGVSLLSAVVNGILAWAPAYFMRVHHWTVIDTGRRLGCVVLFGGIAGLYLGGFLADIWVRRFGRSASLKVVVLAGIMICAFGISAPLIQEAWLSLALFIPLVAFMFMPWGVIGAAIQMIAPNELRAQVSSGSLLAINLFGLGLGPTFVATISEHVVPGNPNALGIGLSAIAAAMAPIAVLLLWSVTTVFERAANDPTRWLTRHDREPNEPVRDDR